MKVLRARRAGFTLVELLVVIAIIVVLMAIALPLFNGARERARQSHCMANLHQIALALRLYRMDEGAYPAPADLLTGEGGLNSLYPTYITNRQTLICPDDPIQDMSSLLAAREFGTLDPKTGSLQPGTGASYRDLLVNSGSMYMWQTSGGALNPAIFTNTYSSYNRYYNYYGYVGPEHKTPRDPLEQGRRLSLLDFTNADQHVQIGESLAFIYEWYRLDPQHKLDLSHTDTHGCKDNCLKVNTLLGLNLARQVYWSSYPTDNDQRLVDGLGRPLWELDDTADPDTGAGGIYPDGVPGEVFPGLVNRNAPDNTIVTRCPNHRSRTTGAGNLRTGKDIALRLDGSAQLIPVLNANYDWALQSSETH